MDFSKFNVRMVSGKVSFEDNLHEMHHQAYFLRKNKKNISKSFHMSSSEICTELAKR